jgi:hypothetical protein
MNYSGYSGYFYCGQEAVGKVSFTKPVHVQYIMYIEVLSLQMAVYPIAGKKKIPCKCWAKPLFFAQS